MSLLLIMIGSGTATLVIGGIIAYAMQGKAERDKRIALVQGGAQISATSPQNTQNHRRHAIADKLKKEKQTEEGEKPKTTMSEALAQAGLRISVKQYWIMAVLGAIALAGLLLLSGQAPVIVVCGFVTGLFGLPKLILKKMASNRQSKFLEDFPDLLEAVVRLLKAGMPVSEAVAMGAREFEGPAGEEMAMMYDQQKIGIPLHDAAKEACRRMPLTEMNMFATSLAIQAQTGSSLSDVLMNLSAMIRSRFRLKRKVKALSSEAIASAGIIGALPVLVATGMYFTNREYIQILFDDPFGNVLLIGAIVWMGIGVMTMKIMINFKV